MHSPIKTLLLVVAGWLAPFASAQAEPAVPPSPAATPRPATAEKKESRELTLDAAAKGGLIAAVVTGNGNSSGDALEIRIQRRRPQPLTITLTPGTIFVPGRPTTQSMAGLSIRGGPIVLDDDELHTHTIEAYCLDFGLDNPSRRDTFTIDRVDRSVGVFLLLGQRHLNMRSLQCALWIALDEDDAWEIPDHFDISREDFLKAVVFVAQARRGKLPREQESPVQGDIAGASAGDSRPAVASPPEPGHSASSDRTKPPTSGRGFGGPTRGFGGAPQRDFAPRR